MIFFRLYSLVEKNVEISCRKYIPALEILYIFFRSVKRQD